MFSLTEHETGPNGTHMSALIQDFHKHKGMCTHRLSLHIAKISEHLSVTRNG